MASSTYPVSVRLSSDVVEVYDEVAAVLGVDRADLLRQQLNGGAAMYRKTLPALRKVAARAGKGNTAAVIAELLGESAS